MSKSLEDQVIALAGLFQATRVVRQIATTGNSDSDDLTTALNSVLEMTPSKTIAVYGTLPQLEHGLEMLKGYFGGQAAKEDIEVTRYIASIIHLERQLSKNKEMLDLIKNSIMRIQQQSQHFPPPHENIIAAIADLYSNSISQLNPKIVVHGEEEYLSVNVNANKVRALLFAAIRAAVLWRQCGGNRWHFIIHKSKIQRCAVNLLEQVRNTPLSPTIEED